MNEWAIIIPGVLNFIVWFLHLNATRRMSILKFLMLVLTSMLPVVNIVVFMLFLLLGTAIKNIEGVEAKSSDKGYPLGFQVEYDETTICGKLILFLTKNR